MKQSARAAATPGFTLVELGVVMGVIMILAGLLFPALCKAKSHAQCTACKSNLRQIAVALTLYVGDSHRYPSQARWEATALPWYPCQKLLPYTANNREVFNCPCQRLVPDPRTSPGGLDGLSYGYNAFGTESWDWHGLGLGSFSQRPIGEAQITAPGEMIAVGDSGTDSVWDMLLNPHEQPLPANHKDLTTINSWLPAKRHRGGANVFFCDTHVEHASRARWVEKTAATRCRWNNDHQPHSESW